MKFFIDYIMKTQQRRYTRKQLWGLSNECLKDLGISRSEANKEASKYFWQ